MNAIDEITDFRNYKYLPAYIIKLKKNDNNSINNKDIVCALKYKTNYLNIIPPPKPLIIL